MMDPDSLDFSSGKELITQKCTACKGGHHARCISDPLVMAEQRENTWPLLDADAPGIEAPAWVCGCFREDREEHPNGDYWG